MLDHLARLRRCTQLAQQRLPAIDEPAQQLFALVERQLRDALQEVLGLIVEGAGAVSGGGLPIRCSSCCISSITPSSVMTWGCGMTRSVESRAWK